ncbi:RidA family protein [Acinetobacter sp. ANC 3791]|uniref:RidA family protein n=1 Tax=Acinetobacter sp. ANC 3791 TaxID=2529836 RepID=UPI00103DBBFE|nr:Rid family hydrolase [Acinetobacter sp. ANC 3791]TCB83889.1 RidA family protein [Acinetobacter sp. ANC 3791]
MKTTSAPQTPCLNILNPETLYNPQPFAYSHVVEVQNFRRILHIAGQGGETSDGELSPVFAKQVWQAFHNLESALHAVDATLQDIAVLRVLIVEHSTEKHTVLIEIMQQLWRNQAFPACTLIPVSGLALTAMLFEVEATAYTL